MSAYQSRPNKRNPQQVMSVALSCYEISTPEIRELMRQLFGHAVSGRTIKRLLKCHGRRMRRGRPPSNPSVYKGDVRDLIVVTAQHPDTFGRNILQLFQEVQVQFGLTPRQYLNWVGRYFRRGKCMMRRCLLCDREFPSMNSGERYCRGCQSDRRRLVNEDRKSSFG